MCGGGATAWGNAALGGVVLGFSLGILERRLRNARFHMIDGGQALHDFAHLHTLAELKPLTDEEVAAALRGDLAEAEDFVKKLKEAGAKASLK